MDGSKASRPKILSAEQDGVWVEALIPAAAGFSEPDAMAFGVSSIAFTRAIGPLASMIVLNSGQEVFLSLPYGKLMEKLRTPEDERVDLKAFTLLGKKETVLEGLKKEFAAHAEKEKYAAVEGLTFTAYVRSSDATDFTLFSFSGSDIQAREITEGGSIMGGKNTRFKMKSPDGGPFGSGAFLLEGDMEDFMKQCRDARAAGKGELDLSAYSLRKGRVRPPAENAAAPGGTP